MEHEKFNELLKEILDRTTNVLASKSAEYASDSDKLHNFKRAGAMLGCSPEKALVGMWTKHIISILDIVDEIDMQQSTHFKKLKKVFAKRFFKKYYGKKMHIAVVEEKITDAINYLILLEALIKEQKND